MQIFYNFKITACAVMTSVGAAVMISLGVVLIANYPPLVAQTMTSGGIAIITSGGVVILINTKIWMCNYTWEMV